MTTAGKYTHCYSRGMVTFSYVFSQAYKAALESMGHSEYALKAGFHLNPKAVEGALQVRVSEIL